MTYKIYLTHNAQKDIEKLKQRASAYKKYCALLNILEENPYQNPPPYEKLGGDLKGLYSRRLNIQHRLLYQVFEEENGIKILSVWTHYEN